MNHTAFFEALKAGRIAGCYLFEGTEEYIKQQALKNLCARLLPEGLEQMNLTDLTDPAPDALIAAAQTLPFLAWWWCGNAPCSPRAASPRTRTGPPP